MRKKRKQPGRLKNMMEDMDEDVKYGALTILFFVFSIFFCLSPLGMAGPVGDGAFKYLTRFFGLGYYIIPTLLLLLSVSFMKRSHTQIPATTLIGSVLFFISGLGILSLLGEQGHGGFAGGLIAKPLLALFDKPISVIFLVAVFLISLFLIYNSIPTRDSIFFWRRFQKQKLEELEDVTPLIHTGSLEEGSEDEEEEEETEEDEEEEKPRKHKKKKLKDLFKGSDNDEGKMIPFADSYTLETKFTPPPLSLLAKDSGKPGVGDIKANTNIIKRTLANFGINVEMDEVSVGPSVTRYALKPAEGVKISRIIGLKNDLSLALAAHPLRIEAPIPGKSLVGIEIPNSSKTTVGLGTLFKASEYQHSPKPLLLALGRGISGREHFANLGKMPHVLIAGTTGSGKSVTIHTIINSLLFRNPSQNLKFIMVDPKRVELTLYNGIPHLLNPVITDAKKAIRALKWAADEMERRYDLLQEHKVRDIESYHETIYNPAVKDYLKKQEKLTDEEKEEDATELPLRMPYIVFVIDELADIMTTYPRELEAGIVRLAQMSRAVGIHLILSTQRPSVNVITGLIKANVPSRIALQVASQIDSRTILDQGGAESLLGAGDMLYLGSEMSKPQRVQSAYITEDEIKKVVKHIVSDYNESLPDSIDLEESASQNNFFSQELTSSLDVSNDKDVDSKYEEAKMLVQQAGKASTSYLQRRMSIGYSRAAKIIDQLEDNGVIGEARGSKPRDVYSDDAQDDSSEEDEGEENNDDEEANDEELVNEKY